jgi:hypothetical protein
LKGAAFALAALQARAPDAVFPRALAPLTKMLVDLGEEDRALAFAAAFTLQRSRVPSTGVTLNRLGALGCLPRLMLVHAGDPAVCECVASLLATCAWADDNAPVELLRDGWLLSNLCGRLRLFSASSDGASGDAAAALCSALYALLRLPCAERREEAASLSVIEHAVAVLRVHCGSARACRAASYLLGAVCAGSRARAARARGIGAAAFLEAAGNAHNFSPRVNRALRTILQLTA